ncbi:hypothetical protein [Candidatus Chlorohelix sp.]|uniref:hypothetical protein n=1 Tax=Candidatus Chlorohelix sp. TaxID=3139201 RepID=UPI003052BC61
MRPIRNYNHYFEDYAEFNEPIKLPKRLPEQHCPRCGNNFPGGLQRCTACGLEAEKARNKPESALPWVGYNRGVIVCKSCENENSDEAARRGRVQKCDLCHKVIYIPSGLHSPYYEANIARRQAPAKTKQGFSEFLYQLQDFLGAAFNKYWRSKRRWILPVIILAFLAFLLTGNLFLFKGKTDATPVAITPAMKYYQQVLPVRGNITQAIENFRIIAGDVPDKSNFTYWRNPNNKERFVRACDETLKSIEGTITQLRTMREQGLVPDEATVHQQRMLDMLYTRQMYYARLKDGLNTNNQTLWNSAFDLKNQMTDAFSSENAALENLRDVVLNSKNASK